MRCNSVKSNFIQLSDISPSSISNEKIGTVINLFPLVSQYVDAKLGLRVRIIPANVMGSAIRRYDPHRRELLLNKKLKPKQIEILYSANTRQHARNKCVHLCAYRYQVLYVI